MNLHARVYQFLGSYQVQLWVMAQRTPEHPVEAVPVWSGILAPESDPEDPHPLALLLDSLISAAQSCASEFAGTRGVPGRGDSLGL